MTIRVALVFFAILAVAPKSHAACNQTLSPGANVANAVANAAAGATICLNAGNYGYHAIIGVVKTSPVTIQSTSGRTAIVDLGIDQSKNLTLQSLTIAGLSMSSNPSYNMKILNNTFTGQAHLMGTGSSATPANILIDGNTFDAITVCDRCYEGRLQLYNAGGIVVSNNHFGGGGDSDGIQLGGYGGQLGPGNVFDGLVYTGRRHVDPIQLYGEVSHVTIVGNYFSPNNPDHIMAPDGAEYVTITNNVFHGNGDYWGMIQLGSHLNDVFTHNTLINLGVSFDKKSEVTTKSQNAVARDNILVNASISTKDSAGVESCLNCTFEHNLFNSSANARGTNNLIGLPTFVGGANPSSWAGFMLASTSLGALAATDGLDMGSTYFGSGAVVVPTPVPSTPTPVPATPTPTPTPVPATPTPAPTTGWKFCASENGTCTFVGTSLVRYGANGVYKTLTITGSTPCTNAVFGDPVYGVTKSCEVPTSTVLGSATPAPTPVVSQRLFSSQVPATTVNNDGVSYELGLKFSATVAGKITAIRFYKSPSESGTHTGKVYSSTGALLGTVTFTNESASGWQEAKLAAPIAITAGTIYTVSVNTGNKYYVDTVSGLATAITNGNLKAAVGSGVYGALGARPTKSWMNSNYFRDIVFVPN